VLCSFFFSSSSSSSFSVGIAKSLLVAIRKGLCLSFFFCSPENPLTLIDQYLSE
jgi:hypothetical protein